MPAVERLIQLRKGICFEWTLSAIDFSSTHLEKHNAMHGRSNSLQVFRNHTLYKANHPAFKTLQKGVTTS
jgi:hypothetical protein